MKHNKYIIILSLLFFLLSCKENGNDSIIDFRKSETFFIDTNITLESVSGHVKIASFDDTTYYYYLDWAEHKIMAYNIKNNKVFLNIDIDSLFELMIIDNMTQLQWVEKEMFGVFSNNSQLILFIDLEGNVLKKEATDGMELGVPFVSVSFFDRTFSYLNNKVYLNKAYTDFVLNSKENFQKYYSRTMFLMLDLKNKDKSHFAKAPYDYRKGNSYADYDIYTCIGEGDLFVTSYTSCDSVYIYKGNVLVNSLLAGSGEAHKFTPYNITKSKDLSYFRKYTIEQPYYKQIIYDKYRNLYYRVFKMQNKYLDENGKIQKNFKWSLNIFDTKFKKLDEIIFKTEDYSTANIFPVSKGVIIGGKVQKGKVIDFTLFKIDVKK